MLARMGGARSRCAAYYQGRYTDNDMITFQVELRQHLAASSLLHLLGRRRQRIQRSGAVRLVDATRCRPALKKRVNVRLDYGFGKKTSGFLLSINEAFWVSVTI